MIKKLSVLFEALSECVIAATDGKIIYRNTSARQTEGFASAQLNELIPDIRTDSGDFITEATIGGVSYAVSVTVLDETTVYVFRPEGGAAKQETEIIAAIGASLREPLAVMNLAAERLKPFAEESGDERISEYASVLHRGVFSVLRTLNRLDALRFLAGGPIGEFEPVQLDLVTLTSDLINSVTLLLELEPDAITLTAEKNEARLLGDKRLIERMLLNLIGNALIFSSDDPKIKIAVKKAADKVIITVADNGGGIADAARYDVWSRFGAKRELSDTKRGSGFGLSIVQAVARLHGGSALLESQEGSGTTVVVSLAVKPDGDMVPVFDAPSGYATVNDMREIFTELVNIIPKKKFSGKYMD